VRSEASGTAIAAASAPSAKAAPVEVVAAREPAARVSDGAPAAGVVSGAAGTIAPREATPPALVVNTPVAAPGWHDDVAKGLAHVVSLRLADAEIRLNPAHLGPVGIEITYSDNQASVLVTAAQPATRDALEQALPQLKELLAQQGITLGESAVRGEGQSRSDADPAASARGPRQAAETADRSGTIAGEPEVARGGRPAGRIDTFA
jgi:flagellar hook-length control protein FliK